MIAPLGDSVGRYKMTLSTENVSRLSARVSQPMWIFVAFFVDLPRKYRTKLLATETVAETAEKPLPYNESLLNTFSASDLRRLKAARATLK